MSCGKGIPVFEFALAVVGLVYIVAQWLVATSFQGYWRMASFLPLPIIATIFFGAHVFELALPLDTVGMLLALLPLGLVYLTALSAVHLSWRVLMSDATDHRRVTLHRTAASVVSKPDVVRKHG